MDTSNSTNPHKDELAAKSISFVKFLLTIIRNYHFMDNELLLWQEILRFCEERIQSILRKTQVTEDNSTPAMRWASQYVQGHTGGEILYIKGGEKEIRIRFHNGQTVERKTFVGNLQPFTQRLQSASIIQTHASYSVNIRHILCVDKQWVYMDDFTKVRWGNVYREKNWEYVCHLLKEDDDWGFNKADFTECDL
jgi:hypothetical protein